MIPEVLVAGGGIGGLAAALAVTRLGRRVRVFEQADAWAEVGAGVQLGPNATRLLRDWGLEDALRQVCATPERLVVRRMDDDAELASLPLGETIAQRYGAPYLTVHRADLHGLLLQACTEAGADLRLGQRIERFSEPGGVVHVHLANKRVVEGDLLVGADGIWSGVRAQLLADAAVQPSGHLAYRALIAQPGLPASLRSHDVTVWLGPHAHVVAYPVRGAESLNLVAVVEGIASGAARDWDGAADAAHLQRALGRVNPRLQALVQAPQHWRQWVLHERAVLRGPGEMAAGRVALLGDAAHPMRPYLAQGAAMALEDAAELARATVLVEGRVVDVPDALRHYALNRWQRCARVQQRSLRNGRIFHATGLVRWGRDLSLRLLGPRLLDVPWLYRAP